MLLLKKAKKNVIRLKVNKIVLFASFIAELFLLLLLLLLDFLPKVINDQRDNWLRPHTLTLTGRIRSDDLADCLFWEQTSAIVELSESWQSDDDDDDDEQANTKKRAFNFLYITKIELCVCPKKCRSLKCALVWLWEREKSVVFRLINEAKFTYNVSDRVDCCCCKCKELEFFSRFTFFFFALSWSN